MIKLRIHHIVAPVTMVLCAMVGCSNCSGDGSRISFYSIVTATHRYREAELELHKKRKDGFLAVGLLHAVHHLVIDMMTFQDSGVYHFVVIVGYSLFSLLLSLCLLTLCLVTSVCLVGNCVLGGDSLPLDLKSHDNDKQLT